jgi:hypothetical protein
MREFVEVIRECSSDSVNKMAYQEATEDEISPELMRILHEENRNHTHYSWMAMTDPLDRMVRALKQKFIILKKGGEANG